jgi:hypothetical protein
MLLITDLHLTDNEADRYRWQIWTWVAEYYRRTGDKNLIILGDLTDAKDHHSARLVNGIVKRIGDMVGIGMEVFILKGNHDYIDPDTPYFGFLDQLEYVNYIKDPSTWLIGGHHCLFLPHTFNPVDEWAENKKVQRGMKKAEIVFMHQSVIGSVTSSGYKMTEGLLPSYFKRFRGRVFSGDIHLPQVIVPVTYVGCPYSVRFNDTFDGQVMFIEEDGHVGLELTGIPGRRTLDITSVDEIEAPKGFQVKVRVHLQSIDQWPTYKEEVEAKCKREAIILSSLHLVKEGKLPLRKKQANLETTLDPGLVVQHFGKRQGLAPATIKTGRRILKEN